MELDDYLQTVTLMDCTGVVTHRLTLMVDGRVSVRMGQQEAFVDPNTRSAMPPSVQLGRGEYGHDQVIGVACDLARMR